MNRFDVIVVGAGPAGATAALVAARGGLSVALLERGDHPGSKNMFGGVLHTHSLSEVLPRFYERAPLERAITRRVLNVITDDASLAMDFGHRKLAGPPYNAFSVIRPQFDAWLANEAVAAGASLYRRTVVDDLILESDGSATGVRLRDGAELRAPVTVCADGVNSLLALRAGLRSEFKDEHLALGFKETMALPSDVIESRGGLQPGEGLDMLYVGSFTRGMTGGGFVYTNRDTLSAGVTVGLSDFRAQGLRPEQLLDSFMREPRVTELVRGSDVREFSAHLIPEGGIDMVSTIAAPGVMVVGDAAGLVLNTGVNLEGANLAITSGRVAGETALTAHADRDFGEESLERYEKALRETHALADLETFRGAHSFLANQRIYTNYPNLVTSLIEEVVTVDGRPKHRLHSLLRRHVGSAVGWRSVMKDAIGSRRYV